MTIALRSIFFALTLSASIAASASEHLLTTVPERAVSAVLRLVAPNGSIHERAYTDAGDTATIDPRDLLSPDSIDGTYRYEIVYAQSLDPSLAKALAARRQAGDTSRPVGMPDALPSQSGTFAVANGQVVPGAQAEAVPKAGTDGATQPAAGPQPNDQVFADDVIVQGSLCAGFDCVNNENFGFDTLRLKENNTRIKFEDTSVGAFATHDWQLTANDTASGGPEKFSIEDITASTVPFTVAGSAPNNALYLASNGKIGLRTAVPVLDLHIATGDTPAIRLEQSGNSGFTPQTWDVAGNEANFFIRDITNGSLLPFRIRPGAPSSSIDIAANGNVGIGIASANAKLHVNGDAYVAGTLTQLSSRTSKTNLVAVAASGMLDQLSRLPIWTWNYLRSDAGDRHIGPVAEDFYAAFGFGTSERQLAPSDVAGVALAATQALQHEIAVRDRTIEALEGRLARLEKAFADKQSEAGSNAAGQ